MSEGTQNILRLTSTLLYSRAIEGPLASPYRPANIDQRRKLWRLPYTNQHPSCGVMWTPASDHEELIGSYVRAWDDIVR
jgi:hypothetical protein